MRFVRIGRIGAVVEMDRAAGNPRDARASTRRIPWYAADSNRGGEWFGWSLGHDAHLASADRRVGARRCSSPPDCPPLGCHRLLERRRCLGVPDVVFRQAETVGDGIGASVATLFSFPSWLSRHAGGIHRYLTLALVGAEGSECPMRFSRGRGDGLRLQGVDGLSHIVQGSNACVGLGTRWCSSAPLPGAAGALAFWLVGRPDAQEPKVDRRSDLAEAFRDGR
jgi:hypothetical protein